MNLKDADIGATAKVLVELSVTIKQGWGPDSTVAEVHKDAAVYAIQHLTNALEAGKASLLGDRIEIVGKPKVQLVTYEAK